MLLTLAKGLKALVLPGDFYPWLKNKAMLGNSYLFCQRNGGDGGFLPGS